MSIEREHKFLSKHGFESMATRSVAIVQGYIKGSHKGSLSTVRVRIFGDTAFLTIKGAPEETDKTARAEFEYPIPMADANALLQICEDIPIRKRRYFVPWHGLTIEVDQFEAENEGLLIAEIELKANEHLPKSLPTWIGEEVTEDARYYNSALAQKPFKEW